MQSATASKYAGRRYVLCEEGTVNEIRFGDLVEFLGMSWQIRGHRDTDNAIFMERGGEGVWAYAHQLNLEWRAVN